MRRRRVSGRKGRNTNMLMMRESTSDLRFLEQVVTIQFPIQAARTYLQRNMGNKIGYRLVEAQRGESIGMVRAVEVRHSHGGQKSMVTGERVLANGEPASFYVPDHLVTVRPRVSGVAVGNHRLRLEDEVILHVPVRGFTRFLPAIFQGEGPVQSRELLTSRDTALQRWGSGLPDQHATDLVVDADPLRRFLFIFQHVMTTITDRIDRMVDLIDPLLCDAKFLPWLASWVGFDLDESLPVHQQRELVKRAIFLFRRRGTRNGMEEMIRVLTSAPVRVQERALPRPCVLGKSYVVGGRDIVERYFKAEPPGCYLMEPAERKLTSFFILTLEPRERFRNRFGERAAGILRRIVYVVSQERPVHISFTIQFDQR